MKKGLYLYGVHSVEEALELAPGRLKEAWGLDWSSRSLAPLARGLDAHGVRRHTSGAGDLDRLSKGARHQGVVAYVGEWAYEELGAVLDRCEGRTEARLLFLDQVQDAGNLGAVTDIRSALGDDVWSHHEFMRSDGKIWAVELPIIWYSGPERLAEINATYASHGFIVYDAHINTVEGGGLHGADYKHLAWKKRMDPKGLLNSAKSRAWKKVQGLSADEIAALAVD